MPLALSALSLNPGLNGACLEWDIGKFEVCSSSTIKHAASPASTDQLL